MYRTKDIGKIQRHGARGTSNQVGSAAGTTAKVFFQPCGIAQGGGHKQELRVGQFQQRHLPGPAAVRFGVVVELVHHHLVDIGLGAIAKRNISHNLSRSGDDGGIAVDGGVTSHHAHIFRAKDIAESKELLTY